MTRRTTHTAGAALVALLGAGLLGAGLTPPARLETSRGKRVLVIPIRGVIDRVQAAHLHRSLSGAKGNYDAFVFILDTPGGRSDFMARMADEILDLSPGQLPKGARPRTVAFVTKWALSAGSYIAMAADRIYMAPRALIGAARGYVPGPDGLPVQLPKSVEEKFGSVNRAQFRSIAEAKGYPAAIAEGMTDETLEVKKVVYEGAEQYMTGEQIAGILADPEKKKTLRVVSTISPKGRLVTFTASEAVRYDIAAKVVPDLDAVLADIGLAGAVRVEKKQTWGDKLIAVLTMPQIVTLLILIGFGGVWLEMKVPGFGLAGTVAVVAFLLVFSSQFLVGNANAAEILLFLVGVALLAIELFVTPGFGIIGGAGLVCVFLALILAMQPFMMPSAPWEFRVLRVNLLATLTGVAGSLLVLLLAAWLLPGTPVFNRLTLKRELRPEEGFTSGMQEGGRLVGRVGTVVTRLRPAGKMEIDDQTYSVVSDGEIIEVGTKARVLRVDGPRIVVEAVPEDQPKEPDFQA